MTRRLALPVAFVAVVALIAGLQLLGGDDAFQLNLRLKSANGLRDGSEVRTGGVPIGKVTSLRLGPHDEVDVRLALEDGHDVVGQDAAARIVATNLVGEKYVELDPGTASDPRPSGTWLAGDKVGTSVDLDQVLDVLDAGTRTRLAVLINETGFALTHRRTDFNAFLGILPPALDAGRRLVSDLASDNHTVGEVVDQAHGLVARVNRERRELNRVVANVGDTAAAVAAQRAALRQTLAEAPSTLASAQRLLGDLESTTKPLAPAARLISATAPSLRSTLAQVPPFEQRARPALDEVPKVAPSVTRLGVQVAPVVRGAVPTARALSALTTTSGPATRTLGASIDDLLGLAEGWSRSIQLRDGLSHVFRGRASISVDTIQTLTRRLVLLMNAKGKAGAGRKAASAPAGSKGPHSPAPGTPVPAMSGGSPSSVKPVVPAAEDLLRKLLPALAPGAQKAPAPTPSASTSGLLDFLLKP